MANRHRKFKNGGRTVYSGAGSKVAAESHSTTDKFKSGGKVHGPFSKARLDKRARGGGVKSPFSSAAGSGDKGSRAGGRSPRASGGRTVARKDGGKCEKMEKEEEEEGEHRARGGGNWIAGAIKHPGALHKSLGVPEGKKIPAGKLSKAAHSSNPKTAKRARLAQTLKGLHH